MRVLRSIHAWAGAVLATLAAIIAVSGTLLVFKHDYLRAVFPAARQAAATDPVTLGRIAESAQEKFGKEIRSIVFGTADMGFHQVYLRDGGGAYLDGDGQVVTQWDPRGRPEAWLFDLHQRLLAGESGHTVAGVAALAVASMVVTGLIVWLPAARSFTCRVWPRSTRRRDLLTQHRNLGVIAAGPLMLLTLTGAAMVFPDAAKSVLAWALPSDPAPAPAVAVAGATDQATGQAVDWPAALRLAQGEFPEATLRIIGWPDGSGTVSIRLRQAVEWHPNGRTRVELSGGTVVATHDAAEDPLSARAYHALYPLHASRIGGRAYDLVAAVAGISLAVLSLVGLWTFVRQRLARAIPAAGRLRPSHDPALLQGDLRDGR